MKTKEFLFKNIDDALSSRKKMVLVTGGATIVGKLVAETVGIANSAADTIRQEEERLDAASMTFGNINTALSRNSPDKNRVFAETAIQESRAESLDTRPEHSPYIFSNTIVEATSRMCQSNGADNCYEGLFRNLNDAYSGGYSSYLAFGLLRKANNDCAKAQDAFTNNAFTDKTNEQALREVQSALLECSKPVDLTAKQKVETAKGVVSEHYKNTVAGVADGFRQVGGEMVGMVKAYEQAVETYQSVKIANDVGGLVTIAILLNCGYRWAKGWIRKNR